MFLRVGESSNGSSKRGRLSGGHQHEVKDVAISSAERNFKWLQGECTAVEGEASEPSPITVFCRERRLRELKTDSAARLTDFLPSIKLRPFGASQIPALG